MPNLDSEGWLLSAHQIHAKLAARTREEAVLTVRAEVEAAMVEVAAAVVVVAEAVAAFASTRMSVPEVAVVAVVAVVAMEVVVVAVAEMAATAAQVTNIALIPADKLQDAHALNSLVVKVQDSFNAQTPAAVAAEKYYNLLINL